MVDEDKEFDYLFKVVLVGNKIYRCIYTYII